MLVGVVLKDILVSPRRCRKGEMMKKMEANTFATPPIAAAGKHKFTSDLRQMNHGIDDNSCMHVEQSPPSRKQFCMCGKKKTDSGFVHACTRNEQYTAAHYACIVGTR